MTAARAAMTEAMSEAELQDAILDLAMLTGWKVSFAPDWMKRLAFVSMKRQRRQDRRWPPAGLPDLLLAKDGRVIVAELKSAKGSVKPEQRAWLDELAANERVEVFVWRPKDWLSGEIEATLTGAEQP